MTETTIDAPEVPTPAATRPTEVGRRDGTRAVGWPIALAVASATVVVLIALSVLVLLTPFYTHGALDRAGAAGFLGVGAEVAHAVSDATVNELLLGPGTFAIPFGAGGPSFYDAAEASHLRDARAVLYGLLAIAAVSIVVLGTGFVRSRRQARFWRAIAAGSGVLVVVFVVVGLLFLVAFDAAFTVFHQIFFPGGNWSFDFATQRMVQLYPITFWQEATAALGVIVVGLGVVTWWLARRRAHRLAMPTAT